MAAVAKLANTALPSLKRCTEGVERVEEGARVLLPEGIGSRHDDDGARARGSTWRQWRLGAPPGLGEGERGAGARVRVSAGFVAPLKTSRPDWWGHGQRTAATARPRVGAGLWPVSHTEV
jgi:hypothetical protein